MLRSTSPIALLCALPVLFSCSGPPAPDEALCRDVVHRLCLEPRCSAVEARLEPGPDCESTLLARTGCNAADFTFTTPTRERFLECRATLVRNGVDSEAAPPCADVEAAFAQCEDLVTFLSEGAE